MTRNYSRIKKAISKSFSFTNNEIDYIINCVVHKIGYKPCSELLYHMRISPNEIVREAFKFRHID